MELSLTMTKITIKFIQIFTIYSQVVQLAILQAFINLNVMDLSSVGYINMCENVNIMTSFTNLKKKTSRFRHGAVSNRQKFSNFPMKIIFAFY